jgi:hypothetical protein
VLYVEGRDRGDLLVRRGGTRSPYLNLWLDPRGQTAMRNNRYPITEFGIENLLLRLIEVGEREVGYGECQVRFYRGAKVDDYRCIGLEVEHPVRREHFNYHVARILIDEQLHVPVHYASYDWPERAGDPPGLIEEYTYRNLKLNTGLSDADFDRQNPAYGFRKDRPAADSKSSASASYRNQK